MNWIECFGALSIIWGFLVVVLFTDWLVRMWQQHKGE